MRWWERRGESDLITRTKDENRRGGEARGGREEDGKYDKGKGEKGRRRGQTQNIFF